MNTKGDCEDRSLTKLNKSRVRGAVAWLLLLPVAAGAGGVVTHCTEAALRAAMAGGGVVTFACEGTILLANTITNVIDTMLDGTGRQVTISGNDSFTDPKLGPLANNGGPTLTMALLPGSPAIDAREYLACPRDRSTWVPAASRPGRRYRRLRIRLRDADYRRQPIRRHRA